MNSNLTGASAKSYYTYYHPPEQHSYEPSRYSVLLAALWRSIALSFDPDKRGNLIEWVSQLRSYTHVFSAGKALSQTFMDKLPSHPVDTRYLPWVNVYPKAWRWCLTRYTSQTWKIIDTLCNQQIPAHTEPHRMTWLLATLFTIAAHLGEPKTTHQQIQNFYHLVEKGTSYSFITTEQLGSNGIRPPASSAVKKFCHRVEHSAHTCWDSYDPGWYAAAVAYLYNKDDIGFVPLLQPYCYQCNLTAERFVHEILTSSSLSSSTCKTALENLLWTMVSMRIQC